ncbi:MAG: uracil/xanthine transporter [Candidatus Cohnella colombiensis]|uniref:Uracil/xanthine transporter n=1 Tax=Candidatus Cohnella colombiensis TaxID=3121368 RepID=A0AA95EXM8_9BACL|nr:MAG: uracil/xanthine transporter [Cohnella sp.]
MNNLKTPEIWLAGLQWMFYIFMNTIVIPLSLGEAFELSASETTTLMLSAFILTGIASILQTWLGHGYALMDGQAAIWWGLVLSLCAAAPSIGMSLPEVGGSLVAGFLISGLITLLLGALGFGKVLIKLFNPVVIGVSLFLICIQLILLFFADMIVWDDQGQLQYLATAVTFIVAIIVGVLQVKGSKLVSSFSLLIGIVGGWCVYEWIVPAPSISMAESAPLFSLFPWGALRVDIGIMLTVIVVGLINMANSISGINAAEELYQRKATENNYKRSFMLTGIFSIVAGIFGQLPFGVYASSIGFLESTKILKRTALVIGSVMIIALGLLPAVGAFFAQLPIAVGSAVLFIAYLQMFGTAFRTVQGIRFNSRTIFRLALPILLGVCIMNTDAEVFTSLPVYVQPLLSNGLVMGVLVSILLESTVRWSKYEE